MRTRHSLTIATGAVSALSLIPVAQAAAHDAPQAGPARVAAPHASYRALLADLGTVPLERLDTWARTLQSAAAAVPDGTVLTGRARALAKRQLAAAVVTGRRLAALDGLSGAQQAKVDVITSRLAAAAAGLRALLANQPAAIPVTVVPTSTTRAVSANDTRHVCDGVRDGSGVRDGWRRDGRHRR